MAKNITFRSQLIEGVSSFSTDCGLSIIADPLHLVELIVLLARYKEEGVRLSPKVYVVNNISTLIGMLPDSESLKIGTAAQNFDGIKQALKKCSPLAANGWNVYIQNNNNLIEYGVFRGSGNPIAVLIDEILMSLNDSVKVVKVFQVADDCVEVRSNNGLLHYVFLDHRSDDCLPPLKYLDDLVRAITHEVDIQFKEPVEGFLKRIFFEALRYSHGCIIAVTNKKKCPQFLSSDGVVLDQAIDFLSLVKDLRMGNVNASSLESKGHLLKGMLSSDGIVIFDNNARLLGYNCFVRSSSKGAIVGGARKRAFASISKKIGKNIRAVFMQSQDGWTDFKDSSNE